MPLRWQCGSRSRYIIHKSNLDRDSLSLLLRSRNGGWLFEHCTCGRSLSRPPNHILIFLLALRFALKISCFNCDDRRQASDRQESRSRRVQVCDIHGLSRRQPGFSIARTRTCRVELGLVLCRFLKIRNQEARFFLQFSERRNCESKNDSFLIHFTILMAYDS